MLAQQLNFEHKRLKVDVTTGLFVPQTGNLYHRRGPARRATGTMPLPSPLPFRRAAERRKQQIFAYLTGWREVKRMAVCSSARAAGICTAEPGSRLCPLHQPQPAMCPRSHHAPQVHGGQSLRPRTWHTPVRGPRPQTVASSSFSATSLTSLRNHSLLIR